MANPKLTLNDVLIRPIITEKSFSGEEYNKYTFEVHRDASKYLIKEAIEKIFNVKVEKINVINVKPKPKRRGIAVGRTRSWKKAVVTLVEGYRIKELEGQH